jgi:hypothetical protein
MNCRACRLRSRRAEASDELTSWSTWPVATELTVYRRMIRHEIAKIDTELRSEACSCAAGARTP